MADIGEPRAAQPGAPFGILQPSPGTVASLCLPGVDTQFRMETLGARAAALSPDVLGVLWLSL